MNFNFAEQINPLLEKHDFKGALDIAETALRKIPTSGFHSILERSLLSHTDELVNWIDIFHKTVSKKIDIRALYFEMNEFDINTDVWYVDGFAYNKDGGLYITDMEWLCDFSKDTSTDEGFVLRGYEKLQDCFKNIDFKTQELQDAEAWCEQIIITRFMELMKAAHEDAKMRNLKWASVPIYFTEHAYDFILRSENS